MYEGAYMHAYPNSYLTNFNTTSTTGAAEGTLGTKVSTLRSMYYSKWVYIVYREG